MSSLTEVLGDMSLYKLSLLSPDGQPLSTPAHAQRQAGDACHVHAVFVEDNLWLHQHVVRVVSACFFCCALEGLRAVQCHTGMHNII